MTSINTVNATPQIDSWMVDKLFGAATNDQIADKSRSSTPTLAPASVGAAISNTTGQALLQLKTGGNQSDDAQIIHVMNADQINALIKSNNAMSSDQLNAAMYRQGIENFGGFTVSVHDQMEMLRTTATSEIEHSTDPALTSSERQTFLSNSATFSAYANIIEQAYNRHEILFQKASDVEGLDYKGTVVADGVGVGMIGESYNEDYVFNNSDGKHHSIRDFGGGVKLFLTW